MSDFYTIFLLAVIILIGALIYFGLVSVSGISLFAMIILIGLLSILGLIKGIYSKKISLISISFSLAGIGILISAFQWVIRTEYYGGPMPNALPFFSTIIYYAGVLSISIFGLIKGIKIKSGLREILLCVASLILAITLGFWLSLFAIAVTV